MSTMSQFFGSAILSQQLFTSSATWTAPVAGMYQVTAIGGGASGTTTTTVSGQKSGGAGGAVVSLFSFAAGQSLTLTVGAGGAATGITTGSAGGATSVSGTGITTMTAGGASAASSFVDSSGGSASGGNNFNLVGQNGSTSGFAVSPTGSVVGYQSGTLVGVYSASVYGRGGNGLSSGTTNSGFQGCVLIEFLIPA